MESEDSARNKQHAGWPAGKVSRATSPYISAQLLEAVMTEERRLNCLTALGRRKEAHSPGTNIMATLFNKQDMTVLKQISISECTTLPGTSMGNVLKSRAMTTVAMETTMTDIVSCGQSVDYGGHSDTDQVKDKKRRSDRRKGGGCVKLCCHDNTCLCSDDGDNNGNLILKQTKESDKLSTSPQPDLHTVRSEIKTEMKSNLKRVRFLDACVMTSDFEYDASEFNTSVSSTSSSENEGSGDDTNCSDDVDMDEVTGHHLYLVQERDGAESSVSKDVNCSECSERFLQINALSEHKGINENHYDNNANAFSNSIMARSDITDRESEHKQIQMSDSVERPYKQIRKMWCESCNSRLVEFKRQAIKMWIPFASKRGRILYQETALLSHIEEQLFLPTRLLDCIEPEDEQTCQNCATSIDELRQETVNMVQNLERTQAEMSAKYTPRSPRSDMPQMRSAKLDKPPKGPLLDKSGTTSEVGISRRAVRAGLGGSRIPLSSSVHMAQKSKSQQQLPVAHRSVKQRSHSAHASSSHNNQTNTPRQERKERSRSHDLPPRKDSPFPQAIAADRVQRQRMTSQQANAWMQQTRKAFHQVIARNGCASQVKSTPPRANSPHFNSNGYTHYANLEITKQDYTNMNGTLETSQTSTYTASPAHRPVVLHLSNSSPCTPTHGKGRGGEGGLGSVVSPVGSTSSGGSTNSAAASFFARAAQRFSISSKKRKKKDAPEPEPPPFPTNFRDVIQHCPPPVPPCLFRNIGKVQGPPPGKVKVMLRLCPVEGQSSASFLSVDARKKQISVTDPTVYQGYTTPSLRRPMAPRLYEFDSIFPQDDSLAEMCSTGLVDILQSVVNGNDGCLFCYGHARLGKTYTMIGVDEGAQNLGIIPSAISWLFRLIDKHKERTGARFSVRVSAVEVTGKQEALKDLLADIAKGQELGRDQAPGVYLREDPICGTQLENQSELRATTADRAAYFLDAAIAARTIPEVEEDARNSHLLFTIHVYQYRVEKGARSSGTSLGDGFDGGRSRLHLIDLGSCSKGRDSTALSLSALGNVIQALLNGQRQLPYRNSKLTQLLKESMGNSLCQMCMIAHVSPAVHSYNETLQVIQLASKIHRTKRRVMKKFSGTSSDDSSSCDSESIRLSRRGYRPGIRMGTLRELSHSDPDYTSSSEQSCDTVIYRGPYGRALSDHDTDNEHPPSALPLRPRITPKTQPRTVPNFNRSRSSGDEGSETERSSVSSPAHDSRLPRPNSKDSKLDKVPSSIAKPRHTPSHVALAQLQNKKVVSSSVSLHLKSSAPPGDWRNVAHSYTDTSVLEGHWSSSGGEYPRHPLVPGYYKENAEQTAPVYGHRTTGSGEHWIDGPMRQSVTSTAPPHSHHYANITPTNSPQHLPHSNKHEHWVDGPNAPPNPVNPKALHEQWIDGPSAFMVNDTEAQNSPVNRSSALPKLHLKQQHQCRPQYQKRQAPELQTAAALTNQIVEDITPITVESPSRAPRSNVLETIEESKHETNTLDKPPVKSFVADWLEKHTGGVASDGTDDDVRPQKARHKHDKLKYSGDDLLSGNKHRKSKPDRYASPRSSPSRSRKDVSIASAKASKRTLAWVESVTEGRTHCDGQEDIQLTHDSPNRTSVDTYDISKSQQSDMSETMQSFNAVIANLDEEIGAKKSCAATSGDMDMSPPPDYESIVLSDQLDNHVHPSVVHTKNNSHNELNVMNGDCNDNITKELTLQNIINKAIKDLDDSQDSDVPVGADKDNIITNLFMSNRDSIYELQFDEQLETSRSSVRNSFHSEDDAWSLGSLPKETDDKRAVRYANMANKALDNIQVPPLTLESEVINYKVSTLDSGNGTQLDNSFATTEQESKTSRLDLDTSTGVSTMDSHYRSHSNVIDLEKEYSHILDLCNYDDTKDTVYPTRSVDQSRTKTNPVRPSTLRRPDGSSNPNLCDRAACSPVSSPTEQSVKSGIPTGTAHAAQNGSVVSNCAQPCRERSPKDSKNGSKKPSVGPKPDNGTTSPVQSPDGMQTKLTQAKSTASFSSTSDHVRSSSVKSESSRQSSSHGTGYSRSHSAPAKSVLPAKTKGDKSSKLPKSASPSGAPAVQHKPPKTQSKNSFASRLPLCNGKRNKEQPGPIKQSSSGRDSKNTSKDSKSISFKFRSKSPSPSKRDKESKLSSGRSGMAYFSDKGTYCRGGDSDSGNDSGIVKYDVRFLSLSPVTKRAHPRISMHSMSSGHGSDVSSTFSSHVVGRVPTKKELRADQCNSSGYESMLRDSEVTGTSSSNHESTSDSGHSERGGDSVVPKKRTSSKRSKSVPAHSAASTPLSSRHSSPTKKSSYSSSSGAASPKTWLENRKWDKHNDPIEIKVYDIEDVERMARRRKEETELKELAKRREKIRELLAEQDRLKNELYHAKRLLMADPESWSFDLLVAGQTDRDDQDFLDALERETEILAKRVEACKSRIMVVTCFDKTITTNVQDLKGSC